MRLIFDEMMIQPPAAERAQALPIAMDFASGVADQVDLVLQCLDMDDWPASIADQGLLPRDQVEALITSLAALPAGGRVATRAEHIARLVQASQRTTDEALLRLAADTLRALPELQPQAADVPPHGGRGAFGLSKTGARLQRCLLEVCTNPGVLLASRALAPTPAASADPQPLAIEHPGWLTRALWDELTRLPTHEAGGSGQSGGREKRPTGKTPVLLAKRRGS